MKRRGSPVHEYAISLIRISKEKDKNTLLDERMFFSHCQNKLLISERQRSVNNTHEHELFANYGLI